MPVLELVFSGVPEFSVVFEERRVSNMPGHGEWPTHLATSRAHMPVPQPKSRIYRKDDQQWSVFKDIDSGSTCGFASAWFKLSKSIICAPQSLYLLATMKNLCIASIRSISILSALLVSHGPPLRFTDGNQGYNSTYLIYWEEVFPFVPI